MNLHGIDLNLLVAFDALMAERHVTRAGARIGRTQPAMSAALSRLRSLFQDELFVRGPNGLQPTPRALELAEPLGRALADIQRTLDFTQNFDPAASSACLRLGLSDHPAWVLLPSLVDRLRNVAPNVTLQITNFTARNEAVPLLDSGEIDLAVGVPPTPPNGRILTRPIFDEPFVCIVRRDHPAAKELDLTSFLNLSHVLVSPENERWGHVDAELIKGGLKRRLALTLPQMYIAPALIARSDMIATVMAGVVGASGHRRDLTVLKLPFELDPVPFVMFWHRRNDTHPAQRWFRDFLASIAPAACRVARQPLRELSQEPEILQLT